MATEADDDATTDERPEDGVPDDTQDGDAAADASDGADDDEDVVTFGGQAARAEDEGEGVRNLRARLREVERENRELKGAPKDEPLPPEPDIDDFDYDPVAFKAALREWDAMKAARENAERDRQEAARRQQERFERQQQALDAAWGDLKVTGKDTARAKVEEAFDEPRRALLVKAARGNAALYIALGANPEKLRALQDLKDDPAEFLIEAALLAKEVKVEKRKPTTQPEQVHRGTAGGAGRSDSKLERLQEEARRTGDRTKLNNYQRENGLV